MADRARISIDSNVLIDILIGSGSLYAPSKILIDDAEMGLFDIVVSEVVVAEAIRLEGSDRDPHTVEEFLKRKYFWRYPVTADVSIAAGNLIREHRLETCDALIMATAQLRGARTLYTHDGEARKRLRRSQSIPKDVPTSLGDMKVTSPLYDKDLCRRAGVPVGGRKVEAVSAKAAQSNDTKPKRQAGEARAKGRDTSR